MKRLVSALAAVVLGSGCIVTTDPCDRTITTDWVSFTYWNGAWVSAGCASAGAWYVDVWMNSGFVGRFACSDGGVVITGVDEGSHDITVEGIDSTGTVILYRDMFTVSASSCGDHYEAAYPAEGLVNLDYAAPGGCTSGPCYLWLSVHDDIANVTAAAFSASGGATTLTYPDDVVLALPYGDYSLDWMQLVSSGTQQARACLLPTFSVPYADTYVLSPAVTLVQNAYACP
jgi:hypothetical protein